MIQTEAPRNSADQEVVDEKTPRRALRVNGVAKFQTPFAGSLVINHREAYRLILATEGWSDFKGVVKDELPAIVSHWLQSPKEAPILLDDSYRDKWLDLLRRHCLLASRNAAAGLPEETAHPRPVHIDFSDLPFPPVEKPQFTFIDLFAGIGGFRIAMQELGGRCVFTSEWDSKAKETYSNNYGEVPFGDITQFTQSKEGGDLLVNGIPQHDVLCGGFPCQPFSQAGLKRGFEDARGTLFFDILKIAKERRPKVLFLENVKRLRTHDSGKTFSVICNSLREIGYKVYAKVLRAYDFGVPQNRERIFIVAFSEPMHFEFPEPPNLHDRRKLGGYLEEAPDEKFTISDAMWSGHQRRLKEHREKGNGFGYSLFDEQSDYVSTISARYWKDGSEVLIAQKGRNPRILTPRECARIQGFPDQFEFHHSKRYAYQQFGNSVAVPVINAIGEKIVKALRDNKPATGMLEKLEPEIF
jgi:DNA (cytosine-5)-methyltransferase 1